MESKYHTKNVPVFKIVKSARSKVDKLVVLYFVIGISLLSFSQNQQKIDSLELLLNSKLNTEDTYTILAKLWDASINYDIGKAMNYSNAIIDLGKNSNLDSIMYYGYERKAVTHSYKNEFDSSKVYFKQALKFYSSENAYSKTANIQRNIGQDHNMLQSLDSANYYYDLAENNFKLAKDTIGIGDIFMSKSVLNLQRGYYNLGLDYGIKSAKIAEKYNNQLDLHQTYLPIAACYSSMNDTINALEYYNKTATYFKNNDYLRQYTSSLILMASLYNTTKTIDKGIEAIDKAIEIAQSLEDYSRLGNALNTKSNLYHTKGDHKKAMELINESLLITTSYKDLYNTSENYKDKADIFLSLKDYNNAVVFAKKALQLAQTLNLIEVEMKAQNILSKSYEVLYNYKDAITAYKSYQSKSAVLYNSKKSQQMEELKTIYETEKKEKEIALKAAEIEVLKQKEAIAKNRQIFLGIIIFSIVLLASALFYGLRQKMKRNKVEREKLDASLQFKEKELTTHALHLAHKNEVLLDLKSQLKELKSGTDNSKSFQKVINAINLDINNDNNWEQFRTYFEDVHKDFNSKVKRTFPEVTSNDLRLMSLLKMNLSSKEIANILNISTEGVKKARYRLRKKLSLSTEESLQELIIEL